MKSRALWVAGFVLLIALFQNCGTGITTSVTQFASESTGNELATPTPGPGSTPTATPTPAPTATPSTTPPLNLAPGTVGVWQNVTPAGVDLVTSFGAATVVLDPVRASDIYAFTNLSGVWKSTDYGLTWIKVSTGRNSNIINASKLWTAVIDPSVARNPATPPTLYTACGNNACGVAKSIDGGVNWDFYNVNNTTADPVFRNDLYSLDINPFDSQHLIGGMHGNPGLSESLNGGVTWRTVNVPLTMGVSVYPFFIKTGNATTTRNTWLTQAQEGSGSGVYRTADGGATWTLVGPGMYHAHGSWQIAQRNGVVYIPAYNSGGIFRSNNFGVSWTNLANNFLTNTLVATATRLYSFNMYASMGPINPQARSATIAADGTWNPINVGNMNNGALSAVATFDGTRWIIVSGNWNSGFWRYIEP